MSGEPTPPPPAQLGTLILVLLLLVCAALVYLDFMRQGEIEGLHMRIDGLAPPQPLRSETVAPLLADYPPQQPPQEPAPPMAEQPPDPAPPQVPAAPATPHPLIAAVMQARTDGELSEFGQGGRT